MIAYATLATLLAMILIGAIIGSIVSKDSSYVIIIVSVYVGWIGLVALSYGLYRFWEWAL